MDQMQDQVNNAFNQANNAINQNKDLLNQNLGQAQETLNKACDSLSGDLKTKCEEAKNGAMTTQVRSVHYTHSP